MAGVDRPAKRRARQGLCRCPWATTEQYIEYHDKEWGVPVDDDWTLFEFLILEGAQAGLSWETILKKRDNYREAFDRFDPANITGLVENFHTPLDRHGPRIIAFGRVPYGEDDDFLPIALLLDAEVAVTEAAGHEVAARHGLFDRQFGVEVGGFRDKISQMDGTSCTRRLRLARLLPATIRPREWQLPRGYW